MAIVVLVQSVVTVVLVQNVVIVVLVRKDVRVRMTSKVTVRVSKKDAKRFV